MTSPSTEARIEFDVPATMRDGTVLRADVYRPGGDGPWPVLLVRTPYAKDAVPQVPSTLRRGFMLVVQDTRGRFASDGEWEPFRYEEDDGYDTVRWAAALPGSSGVVGMLGGSYLGHTQWMAALSGAPELKAIAPAITWSEPADGCLRRGGAAEFGIGTSWSLIQLADTLTRRWRDDPPALVSRLGALVAELDTLTTGPYRELPAGNPPVFARHDVPAGPFLGVTTDPAAADVCRVAGRHAEADVAALNIGGWYDIFTQGTIDNHVAMVEAGRPSRLLMGPWTHGPMPHQVGDVNFGLAAGELLFRLRKPLYEVQLDWFDQQLRGDGVTPDGRAPDGGLPVTIFVMGVNEWRDEPEWPLARAVDTTWYLRSGGRLSRDEPGRGDEPATYAHDPADPVPTHGGALLLPPEFRPGPLDQEPVEARRDVLVFSSDPLPEDLEVTGRVTVVLHATTTAPSTDWVARLCDVDEHGVSRNVADGILRVDATPGEAGAYEIDLWSTSIVFLAGHRLRVQVASSCFPRWDRNPGTGEPATTATTLRPAHQTIHLDAAQPSRIVLPVVTT